jgi:hypothetical protein
MHHNTQTCTTALGLLRKRQGFALRALKVLVAAVAFATTPVGNDAAAEDDLADEENAEAERVETVADRISTVISMA